MRRFAAASAAAFLLIAPAQAKGPDASEAEALLGAYAEAWASLDAARLEAHWDVGDDAPLYIAEEVDAVFSDWSAVRGYWRANAAYIAEIDVAFDAPVIKELGAREALVAAQMRWRVAFKSAAMKPIAGDNRVVALVRRKDGAWKLAAWIEAPLAPLAYLRRELERDAAPIPSEP